jgi:hypothetical protein
VLPDRAEAAKRYHCNRLAMGPTPAWPEDIVGVCYSRNAEGDGLERELKAAYLVTP